MSFPSVKIAGALKGTFGIEHYKCPLTTNVTRRSNSAKLHQYCETCLLSILPSCQRTIPTHGERDQFATTAYGRAHHVLLSKCHSKAIPTPEKPEQHGHAAACILLMDSHMSCPRKLFPLYSCHLHG